MRHSLLAIFLVFAVSQSLAMTGHDQAAPNKDPATSLNRSEQSPIFVKVVPSEQSLAEARKDKEDWALIVIGIIQAAIFCGQWYVFSKQAKTLERTIESNERIERPYVFVHGFSVRRDERISVANAWFIRVTLKNLGRTPARIDELRFHILPLHELPTVPNYEIALPMGAPRTLAANKSFKTREVGPAGRDAMKDGKPVIYVAYGKLTYRDLTGKECHTGFGVEVDAHMPVGQSVRNEAYNYYD